MCKKATLIERNDLRISMHPWNDGFTSVLQKRASVAAENKWEVVLIALLNLPLFMRHYFDHILLVAIAQSKWATANGGITRILCGVGEDGEELKTPNDAINLFAEIRASKERKITINLPDDANPGNEKGIDYTLILGITCISLDWLANGAFGPFAEAVSANRPCFKCMWTPQCGCAWIARTDGRNSTIVHSALCRRKRPRTHDETMQVVREMRLMSSADLKASSTEEGIFSTVFASEYLLDDIVKDATIDGMHIFFASGVVPYQLSWLTDICIPTETSWAALNAATLVYNSKRKGHRIPWEVGGL